MKEGGVKEGSDGLTQIECPKKPAQSKHQKDDKLLKFHIKLLTFQKSLKDTLLYNQILTVLVEAVFTFAIVFFLQLNSDQMTNEERKELS